MCNNSPLVILSVNEIHCENTLNRILNYILTHHPIELYILPFPECIEQYTESDLLFDLKTLYNTARSIIVSNKYNTKTVVLLPEDKSDRVTKPWDHIYYTCNTQIKSLSSSFMSDNIVKSLIESSRLISPQHINSTSSLFGELPTVAVGGTFDHLHDGHRILLTLSAYLAGKMLIVGVTGPELLKNKKFAEYMEPYEKRVFYVKEFLKVLRPELDIYIEQINDVCGPTASIQNIDALIVSQESEKGADYVNEVRRNKGWKELRIHVVNVIGGSNQDNSWSGKLSSTDYRRRQYEKNNKIEGNCLK